MRKKVLLFGYSRANFGDDFFIYVLAKRYENVEFYIHIKEEKYKKPFINLENVKFVKTDRNVDEVNLSDFDSFIYIGGSIFIESEYSINEMSEFTKFTKKCKQENKPFFYMTCNFGPYYHEEYVENAKKLFQNCEGVCFRDLKSYDLFKSQENISYAPDVAFAYNVDKYIKNKKMLQVGISVIDLSIRENLKGKEEIYNDYIKRIAIMFAKRGYTVNLISFCEFEQDLEAINKIKDMIPKKYERKIKVVNYDGNIENFLKEYSKNTYMICTRFHSMILSTMLRQKIYTLSYSKKTNNVKDELKIPGRLDDISDLNYDIILKKTDFEKIDKEKLNMIAEQSNKQFSQFEKWLNSY